MNFSVTLTPLLLLVSLNVQNISPVSLTCLCVKPPDGSRAHGPVLLHPADPPQDAPHQIQLTSTPDTGNNGLNSVNSVTMETSGTSGQGEDNNQNIQDKIRQVYLFSAFQQQFKVLHIKTSTQFRT